MRTRFIHDDFILDVSHLALSWTEENSWFKDEFFLTSSFPFDISFEENRYFEFFKHYNLATADVYFQGRLEKDGKIEEAILEVEEAGEKLRLTIRYGVEALPNWTKKLPELVLDVVLPEGGSMTAHAETIIPQTYPAVKYNFPAVHTKFYDGAPMFDDNFQGVLNKRVDGTFIYNDADGPNTINRNIVYPFPYFLYVLESAIEDAGYTLHGDIKTDPDFIDAVIVPGKKLANFEDIPDPVEIIVGPEDRTVIWVWENIQEILFRGSFQLTGTVIPQVTSVKILINDDVIYESNAGGFLNIWFSGLEAENELKIIITGVWAWFTDTEMAEFVLTTLYLTDENGEMLPFVANFTNVQLATALPDMTVGDLIKFPKKAKNYDLDLRENKEIWMNLIQNEVTASNSVDVSDYDVKRPIRKFEQAKSFLLQYEGEYDEKYPFDKIYADRTGFFVNDFNKAESTTEININGIPLPVDTIDSAGDTIKTAVQLSDDASKLQLTKYNGLISGKNWAQEMPGMSTINLYLHYWQRWLNFMIHAIKFQWSVKDHPNLLIKIKRKGKLFAYNNYLFVHTLNRKRQGDIEEVEIEAYSSKV